MINRHFRLLGFQTGFLWVALISRFLWGYTKESHLFAWSTLLFVDSCSKKNHYLLNEACQEYFDSTRVSFRLGKLQTAKEASVLLGWSLLRFRLSSIFVLSRTTSFFISWEARDHGTNQYRTSLGSLTMIQSRVFGTNAVFWVWSLTLKALLLNLLFASVLDFF